MRPSSTGRHRGLEPSNRPEYCYPEGVGTMELASRKLLDCCSAPTLLIAIACSPPMLLAQYASQHEPQPTPRKQGIELGALAALGRVSRTRASLYLRLMWDLMVTNNSRSRRQCAPLRHLLYGARVGGTSGGTLPSPTRWPFRILPILQQRRFSSYPSSKQETSQLCTSQALRVWHYAFRTN